MFYSDDPVRDFERHDRMKEEMLENLPICDCCGKPIDGEYRFEFIDETLCEECTNRKYRIPNY